MSDADEEFRRSCEAYETRAALHFLGIELGKQKPTRLNIGLDHLAPIYLKTHSTNDIISECIRRFRIWEIMETQYVCSKIEEGHNVIDLGANIGYFTAIFSRLAGDAGSIFAFEPNDLNFALLLDNIHLNRCTNVHPFKAICADSCGVGVLRESSTSMGMHEAVPDSAGRSDLLTHGFDSLSLHPRITLDAIFHAGIRQVDFMKIDTQGSEYLILKGAEALLRENVGHLTMVVEFSPYFIRNFLPIAPLEFLQYARSFGFQLSYFDRLNARICRLEPCDDIDLIARVDAANGETWMSGEPFADIICEPPTSN